MQRENKLNKTAKNRIARGALTVMAAFIVSNLIGLYAKTLTARYFGTGIESSAFFAANRFAEILFNLVAGGALGSAFIPVFTQLLVRKEQQKAWKLASSTINLVSIVLVSLSVLTFLFSESVVRYILAPGFSSAETALTARLLRIQVLSSIIFGISGLVMAILNSHQHFFLPAIAPAMYQMGWIFGIYALTPSMGINGLAWGVVIGALFHMIVQLPKLFKLPGQTYSIGLGLHLPEVKEVARLMAPRLLGVAIVQLNFLLNTYLASFLETGAITALSLAFPLMIMPEAAIAQSIAIAALPTFSALVADNNMNEMRNTLTSTLRAVLLLAIPATIGLIMLRNPIVQILYGGRAFDENSIQLVSWALLWYAAGLVGHSLVEISSRAFYALHDTRTPVFIGVGAMAANLALSFLFTSLFRRIGWMPHGGLALSNSLATAIECVILLILMNRKLAGIHAKSIVQVVLKSTIASAAMAIAIQIMIRTTALNSAVIKLGLSILFGGLIYVIGLYLLRTLEIRSLLFDIWKRIIAKLQKDV